MGQGFTPQGEWANKFPTQYHGCHCGRVGYVHRGDTEGLGGEQIMKGRGEIVENWKLEFPILKILEIGNSSFQFLVLPRHAALHTLGEVWAKIGNCSFQFAFTFGEH